MKYYTTRYFYPHGIEGESMDNTFIEWDDLEKAIKYCHRYNKGTRFAGVQIEDENGKTIYEITSGNDVFDYRNNSEEIKEEVENNSIESVIEKIENGIIKYPEIKKNHVYDDGAMELILLDENKNRTEYDGIFYDLKTAVIKLAELNLHGRFYIWTNYQKAHKEKQWYIPIDFL